MTATKVHVVDGEGRPLTNLLGEKREFALPADLTPLLSRRTGNLSERLR